MFLNKDIIEFINKIINQASISDSESIKENILKFKNYLELTKMCDKKSLEDIDVIINCVDELIGLKDKIGNIDINIILKNKEEKQVKEKKKVITKEKTSQSLYDEKHYHHYSFDNSSSCGGGSSYRGC